MSNGPRHNRGKQNVMTKKEQFLAFILVGAAARDASASTNDAQLILRLANQIRCEVIPVNVMNAAKVYLAYCNDPDKRPYRWMLPERTQAAGPQ